MNLLMIQIAMALLLVVQVVVGRCPNWCNKRGECTSPADGGYCICHYGFTGEDCSQRLCPAGFDPVNLEKLPQRRTIRLETGHMGGIMMGKYSFSFAGSEVYLPAHSNDNDETKCVSALKGLKSAQDVSCKREKYDLNTGAGSYLISLLSYPQKPYMNNLIHHNGNPGINLFNCDVSKIDSEEASEPYCFVSNADNTTEFPLYAECGNHGVCDRIKGVCACESGFKGDACLDNSDDQNIVEHIHEGPYFTANLVKLHLEAPPSTKFNLFQASLSNNNITTIRGDGVLLHKGEVRMEGALRVGVGAFREEGESRTEGTANIHGSLQDPITTTNHLALYTNHNPVYTISATGDTTIAGTLNVLNHTLTVEPSLITAQNLKLSHDLHVQGSANIEESLTIGSGFALTPGGITVDVATHTGTLFELKSRQVGFNGTLFELSSVGDDNVLIKTVTNGLSTFELHSSGFVNMNGLRLKSGGVQVESGGIEVLAGGMNVQGGINILSGGLSLPSQPFTVGTLHATSSDTNLQDSIISGTTANPYYAGSMLELTRDTTGSNNSGDNNSESAEMMSFINLLHSNTTVDADITSTTSATSSTSVFQVKGSGQIDSAAGAVFKGPQGLDVYGSMLMRGKLALQRATLAAGDSSKDKLQVVVPLNATYVMITRTTDTTSVNSIAVAFEPFVSSHSAGRILLISNNDSITTSGSVQIPPYTTVLLVYDGENWVSVDALKAPMHVLENVRTLTAAADLDIGPHTLSALRFQSTSLHTNSIIYSGNSGILTTSDKFTYTKGVLAVPAMKVENLLCALDARGNDISNALLTNTKMIGASISAADVTIPGLAGLAYFNNKGTLQASTTLALDPEGRLLVSNLYTNVQANGFSIANTTIMRANLSSIGFVKTSELYISGLNSGSIGNSSSGGNVLVSGTDGKVGSTNGMTVENNVVTIQKLHATTLAGNIDANQHTIANVNIKGSSAIVNSVTTDTLTISSVANPSRTSNRLVYADSTGKISAQEGNNVVHINKLSVNDIVYATNTIDFHGRTVKNIVLDTDTFMLGPQKSLYTDELTITNSMNDSVLISKYGRVESSGMRYYEDALYVGEGSSVYTDSLHTSGVTIDSIKNSVLSTTSDGTVIGTNNLDLDSVSIAKAVQLSATAKLTLSGLTPNTLLTLNANHEMTTIPSAYSKTATSVDAYLHSVHTDRLHSAVFSTDKASIKELTLVNSMEKTSETVSGAVLVQNKDGKVSALSEEVMYVDKGSLHVSSIAPVKGGSGSVHISSALLLHSNLSNSHIHNAYSVDTNKLIVKEMAEFYSDVVIDGSVTIHGTVIGSGPYVDSSDARFKTDVTTLTNSLDTVNKLRPVTYSFNTAAFPARHFPDSPQLGFIAQEVESVQPELVYTDSEGYKGVSYAHVNVLLTAAMQEMQVKHEEEMGDLKEEMSELKRMVQALLKLNR